MVLRTLQRAENPRPAAVWARPSVTHVAVDALEANTGDESLSSLLQAEFARNRPYFNEFITLDGQPEPEMRSFQEWRSPCELASLLATYGDHIYRNHPAMQRENKPLKSLWAQWYIGLALPPLIMALLTQRQGIDLAIDRIHTRFHETGRAATFCFDIQENPSVTAMPPRERLETLWMNAVKPVIDVLDASGDINGKLIWSNTGYLVGWFLGELKPLLGDTLVNELRQSCFGEKTLLNGEDNPLFRTMLLRDGLYVRRTCCQRYRLPDVTRCGDCTLK